MLSETEKVTDLIGGAERDRTADLLNAIQALSRFQVDRQDSTSLESRSAQSMDKLRDKLSDLRLSIDEVIILSEALLESLHFPHFEGKDPRNVPPEHSDPVWNLDQALEAGTITRPFILKSVRRSLVRPDAPWFGFDGSDLLTRLGGADEVTLAVLVDALRDYWRYRGHFPEKEALQRAGLTAHAYLT